MKRLLLALPLCILLTGCLEKENPVALLQPDVLQGWLEENQTPEMVNCASIWASNDSTSGQKSSCSEAQISVAAKMNVAGLTNKEIEAEHLELPAVWKTFLVRHAERQKERAEVEARIRKRREMVGY